MSLSYVGSWLDIYIHTYENIEKIMIGLWMIEDDRKLWMIMNYEYLIRTIYTNYIIRLLNLILHWMNMKYEWIAFSPARSNCYEFGGLYALKGWWW